jgi:MFS family permease
VLIFLAGSLVSALAPNMLTLIIGRAIQGVGGGGLFALTQTVIGDLVPPRDVPE